MKNGGGVPREILEEGALLLGKLLQEGGPEKTEWDLND